MANLAYEVPGTKEVKTLEVNQEINLLLKLV